MRIFITITCLVFASVLAGKTVQGHFLLKSSASVISHAASNMYVAEFLQDKVFILFTPAYYGDQIDDDGIDDDTIDSILKFILYSSCILLSFFLFINVKGPVLRYEYAARFLYSSRIIFLGNIRI